VLDSGDGVLVLSYSGHCAMLVGVFGPQLVRLHRQLARRQLGVFVQQHTQFPRKTLEKEEQEKHV
jgi:hypothetical protein